MSTSGLRSRRARRSRSVGTRRWETSALPTASTQGGATVRRRRPSAVAQVTRRRPPSTGAISVTWVSGGPAQLLGDEEGDRAAVGRSAAAAEQQDVAAVDAACVGGEQGRRRLRGVVELRPGLYPRRSFVAEREKGGEEGVGLAAADGERADLDVAGTGRVAETKRELQGALVEAVEHAADVARAHRVAGPGDPVGVAQGLVLRRDLEADQQPHGAHNGMMVPLFMTPWGSNCLFSPSRMK